MPASMDTKKRGTFADDQLREAYRIALSAGSEIKSIVPLLGETGCRLAEIVGLRHCDVNMDKANITITPHPERRLKTRGTAVDLIRRSVAAKLHTGLHRVECKWEVAVMEYTVAAMAGGTGNGASDLLVLVGYRIAFGVSGLILAYLGFRLFMVKVTVGESDVEASWNDMNFVVKRAAPGTIFCICGAAIILVSIFKGFDLKDTSPMPADVAQIMMKVISISDEFSDEEREILWVWMLNHRDGHILAVDRSSEGKIPGI